MSFQPVPDGRLADAELARHRLDAVSCVDERLQLVTAQSTAGGVSVTVSCLEAVLLHPIGDRRRIAADTAPDLFERQSDLQEAR
jgi:hypothetical protein